MDKRKMFGRWTRLDLHWAMAFFICLAVILYKCKFGFGDMDESFYLTIPYRLSMGDGLFVHEYHLSQMSFALLYPIVKIYLWIIGTTKGMLLAFRYIFTVLHSITAVFLYVCLRKKNSGAVFVSLIYLLFTPFSIMALSYNSMGVALMCIAAVLIYSNENNSRLMAAVSGVAFSGAVLCCPYVLLVYLYYAAVVITTCVHNKSFRIQLMQNFLWCTLACIGCAALFFSFVMSRCSFDLFMETLPVLFDDPEHPAKSFYEITRTFLEQVYGSNTFSGLVFLCTAILTGIAVVIRKKIKYAPVILLIGLGLTVMYLIPFITVNQYLNFLMFPMVIPGILCCVLFWKETSKEFFVWYIPGLLYGFCMNWSSNQGFYVISNAALLSTVGSILMLMNVWKKLKVSSGKGRIRAFRMSTIALLMVLLLSVFYLRYDTTFWEPRMSDKTMTERIEVGVNKGIYTSLDEKTRYTAIYQETENARSRSGESVLYLSEYTWLYLEDTKQNASYSAWLSGVNSHSSDRLVRYYVRNPEKKPDVVYCSKDDYDSAHGILQYLLRLGYQIEEYESSYLLVK